MKEFLGHIITVYTSLEGKRGTGLVMENCSVKEFAGRTFLVGTVVDTGEKKNYWTGTEAAIPWDTIASLHSMTQDQFEERKRSW